MGDGVLKVFESRDLEQAVMWAARGGQALHLHRFIADRSRAPKVFVDAVARGEDIAHLFDQDRDRLVATAKALGVRVIEVERAGSPRQHVDLCCGPLRRARDMEGTCLCPECSGKCEIMAARIKPLQFTQLFAELTAPTMPKTVKVECPLCAGAGRLVANEDGSVRRGVKFCPRCGDELESCALGMTRCPKCRHLFAASATKLLDDSASGGDLPVPDEFVDAFLPCKMRCQKCETADVSVGFVQIGRKVYVMCPDCAQRIVIEGDPLAAPPAGVMEAKKGG